MNTQHKLQNYLDSLSNTPLEPGVHDCIVFTNQCWRLLYGKGWADDVIGQYGAKGRYYAASFLQRKYAVSNIEQFVDRRLQRCLPGIFVEGALALFPEKDALQTGVGFGIVLGRYTVCLNAVGVAYASTRTMKAMWVNHVDL